MTPTEPPHAERGSEHGFVLVWFALMMTILLAVSALVVDILYAYSQAQEAQNVADAAATAAVVLRNGPDCTAANARAEDVGNDNTDAIAGDIFIIPVPCDGLAPNQFGVEVERSFDTFFAQFVGWPRITVERSAVAEYDPPIPLGSPINSFGCGPGSCPPGSAPMWASIAGPLTSKRDGNAAMGRWCDDKNSSLNPGVSPYSGPTTLANPNDNCPNGTDNNKDFESVGGDSVQWYVIDVQAGTHPVYIFDPIWVDVGKSCTKGEDPGGTYERMDFARFSDVKGGGGKFVFGNGDPELCTGDSRLRWDMPAPGALSAVPQKFDQCGLDDSDPAAPDVLAVPFFNCMTDEEPVHSDAFYTFEPYGYPADLRDPGTGELAPGLDVYVDQVDHAIDEGNYELRTSFRVFTPVNPLNPSAGGTTITGCGPVEYPGFADIWRAEDAGALGWWREWVQLGTCEVGPGKHFVEVRGAAGTMGMNQFALRAGALGGDPDVQVTAFQRFGFFSNVNGSEGDFFLARVVPSSVDRTLVLSFYDIGDFTGAENPGTVSMQIRPGPDANITEFAGCEFNEPTGIDDGPKPWTFGTQFHPPGSGISTPGPGACEISGMTSSGTPAYNGQWVTVEIPIPRTYTCADGDPEGCWLTVHVETTGGAGANLTDFSTWSAQFRGAPVRIIE